MIKEKKRTGIILSFPVCTGRAFQWLSAAPAQAQQQECPCENSQPGKAVVIGKPEDGDK